MGARTEDAIGLEPVRRGGTAGSGTSPGPTCNVYRAGSRVGVQGVRTPPFQPHAYYS